METIFANSRAFSKLSKYAEKVKLQEITDAELFKISNLTTPQDAVALIKIPAEQTIESESFQRNFTLVLDGVQDPGNLGTIIRTMDWFGFSHLVCSNDTVDAYNPKVVQATMGSLSRIKVHYTGIKAFIQNSKLPVYGALLEGKSVYEYEFRLPGILILGNEGKGISAEIKELITDAVTIPRFGSAESLNVAISAAIFCSEIKRK